MAAATASSNVARAAAGSLHLDLLRLLGRWDDVLAEEPADEQAHLALVRQRVDRGDRRGGLAQLERLEQARGSWREEKFARHAGMAYALGWMRAAVSIVEAE